MNNKKGQNGELRNQGSRLRIGTALEANLARISSREPTQTCSAPKPALTLEEAEALVRSRIEPLPEMMLREVLRLRDHTRYFLMTNGHTDAFDAVDTLGENGPLPKEHAVHEDLKQLLDEIAEEEGLADHLKHEVWGDVHARKVSLVR
jgi:hypothetical protein